MKKPAPAFAASATGTVAANGKAAPKKLKPNAKTTVKGKAVAKKATPTGARKDDMLDAEMNGDNIS